MAKQGRARWGEHESRGQGFQSVSVDSSTPTPSLLPHLQVGENLLRHGIKMLRRGMYSGRVMIVANLISIRDGQR